MLELMLFIENKKKRKTCIARFMSYHKCFYNSLFPVTKLSTSLNNASTTSFFFHSFLKCSLKHFIFD